MAQRLFILSPETVFAARVAQASFTYPVTSVDFDTVTTGAYTAIKPGMTVLFGSSAGADDLGRQRIRAAADSDTIFIGRSSQGVRDGEVNLSDNDYITVIDDYRVWAKIPDIDDNGDIVKDEIAFTDETENIPPKANIIGGAVAATTSSSIITVAFVGTDSYAVASGATISTYLWDVDDGTITVGTSASNSITATFPAGFRWVSLTVTDSNGNTHTTRVPVYARNASSDTTTAFQCVEHRITQQGQFCSFRILEDIDIATYPDGTLVIFFDGEPASSSDRTNVRFWGWHQTNSDSTVADDTATLRDTVLNCLDVAGKLDTLPGFPQSVERTASPANWLQMANLDMELYIDYLFRWHSTAFENAYYKSNIPSGYDVVIIGSDGESLFDQVARRCKSIVPDYVLTCNRNGELNIIVDPQLQDTGDRTATSQATIGTNKWFGVNWERMRPPRNHWLWGEAILANDTVISALFCIAPGASPGQGATEQNQGEQLALSQTDLNSCEGHRYARGNAFHGLVPVQIINDADRIEPADMTWVTVNVPDTYTRRQLGFSSARGLPIELTVSYEYSSTGTVTRTEMLWEEETSGTPAITYTPPETDWEPDWTPPPTPIPTPNPTGQGDGFGTVYGLTNNVLGRTRAFSATSPFWANVSPSGTYTAVDFIIDPWNVTTGAYHLSTGSGGGLRKSTDMDQVSPSWSTVLTISAIETALSGTVQGLYGVSCSINVENWVGVLIRASVSSVSGFYFAYSTNGGSAWNYGTVRADFATGPSAFGVVPRLIGGGIKIYAILHLNNDTHCYESVNGGATWSYVADYGLSSGDRIASVHCPYEDNLDGEVVYWSEVRPGSNSFIHRSTTGLSTESTISSTLGTQIFRSGLETYTNNRQLMYTWKHTNGGLYISSDGGDNWTVRAATGISGIPRAAGGFPYNGSQYYVLTTTGIYVSTDGGLTFTDKTGDWSYGFSSASPTDVFYQVIVPVWVPE